MKCLDLTFGSPAENLACDEALACACETGGDEVLRLWKPTEPFVVLGYSKRMASEVNLAACQAAGIPVLRRVSGGGTVWQGAGCLNYALILRIPVTGPLITVAGASRFILEKHAGALEPLLGQAVAVQGYTDLTLGDRKFSGNSQRRYRNCVLFHGTFLLHLELARIEQFLSLPSQQPDYRRKRSHADFLMNLGLPAEAIQRALQEAWQAREPLASVPRDKIAELVGSKYARQDWNERF